MFVHTYCIAGHNIKVEGDALEHVSGFSVFRRNMEDDVLLTMRQGEPQAGGWKALRQFVLEGIACEFLRSGNSYLFRMKKENGVLWYFEITPRDSGFLVITNMIEHGESDILYYGFWIMLGVAALARQTAPMHASAIMYDGKCVLFLGESGIGKSTHARLWVENISGAELLNDDCPFVRVDAAGCVWAWGTPWSGKAPVYNTKHAPVAAFVRLRQAPRNEIKRLSTIEAIAVLRHSFPLTFSADETLTDRILELLSLILSQTPVYMLDCLPDADAVKLVFSTLEKPLNS